MRIINKEKNKNMFTLPRTLTPPSSTADHVTMVLSQHPPLVQNALASDQITIYDIERHGIEAVKFALETLARPEIAFLIERNFRIYDILYAIERRGIEKVRFALNTLVRPELAFLVERDFLDLSILASRPVEFSDELLAFINHHPNLRQAIEENKIKRNIIPDYLEKQNHYIKAADRFYDPRFSNYFNAGFIPYSIAFNFDRLMLIVNELENSPFLQACLTDGRISPEMFNHFCSNIMLLNIRERLRYLAKIGAAFVPPRELLRQVISDEEYASLSPETRDRINDDGGINITISGAAERTVKLMRELGLTYSQLKKLDNHRFAVEFFVRNADILEGFLRNNSQYSSLSILIDCYTLFGKEVSCEMRYYRATVYLAQLGIKEYEPMYTKIHREVSSAPELLEAFMQFSNPQKLADYLRLNEKFQKYFIPFISSWKNFFSALNHTYALLDAGIPFQEILESEVLYSFEFRSYLNTVTRLIREEQIGATDLCRAPLADVIAMLAYCSEGLRTRESINSNWHRFYLEQGHFLEPDVADENHSRIGNGITHCMNREYLERGHFFFFQEDPALIDTQQAYEMFEQVTESSPKEYAEAQFCMALLIYHHSELTPEPFIEGEPLQKQDRLVQTLLFLDRATQYGHQSAAMKLDAMKKDLVELERTNLPFFNTSISSSRSAHHSKNRCVVL